MATSRAVIGSSFGRAICKYFNLSDRKVMADMKLNTGANEVFSVSLSIMLTADDLAGIAQHMDQADPIQKTGQ